MKLRNKNTGEIVVFGEGVIDLTKIGCKNVAEMIEAGWEDYEEPDDFYYIDRDGHIVKTQKTAVSRGLNSKMYDYELARQIGNYFETKEEGEEAVEKLKALKRLKNNGFEFTGWKRDERFCGDFTITATDQTSCDDKDLDLLFGGEE